MTAPDITTQLHALQASLSGGSPMNFPGLPGFMQPQQHAPVPTVAGYPGPAPTFVTATDVNALIDQKLKGLAPAPDPVASHLQAVMGQVSNLAQRALPEAEFKALRAYLAEGGPGFAEMLAGDALLPVMQLMWETIKENKP